MKKILSVLFVLISVIGYSQIPYPTPNQQLGANGTLVRAKGGLGSDSTFFIPYYVDTTAANLSRAKFYPGSEIITSDNSFWMRNVSATRWIFHGNGTGGNVAGQCPRAIISGGVVTHSNLLTLDVTTTTICVSGNQYTALGDSVNLAAADPTNPRQDLIVADTFGLIYSITGTPAVNPAEPSYDPSYQVPLASVNIAAGATTPTGVSSFVIWDENIGSPEWVASATGLTANFNSTTTPYHLTKTGLIGAITNSDRLDYIGAAKTLADYNVLKMFIRLNSAWANTANITVTLMNGGVAITSPLTLGTLNGFNKSSTGTYQNISIPLNDFAYSALVQTVTGIRIGFVGANPQGILIDYITLNGGVSPPPSNNNPYVISYGKNTTRDSTILLMSDGTRFAAKDSIGGGGGGGSLDSIHIENTLYVAKSGNDGTGVRNRLDKPFLTINAALAAATSGDAIVVYPGTYEEIKPLSLAKNVNYQFIGKGELQLLTTGFTSAALFTDSTTVSTSTIEAPGWTFTARSSQRVLYLLAASTVKLTLDEAVSNNGNTIDIRGGSSLNITANRVYGNAFQGTIWISDALKFYGDIDIVEAGVFGNSFWTANTPSVYLRSQRIFASDAANEDYTVYIQDGDATDSVYIEADEIRAQIEWAVWAKGEGENFIKAKTISGNSDCIVVSSTDPGGQLTVEANVIENRTTGTIEGILHGEGGTLTVIGAKVIRNAAATGADIKTVIFGGDTGYVRLQGVVYDITKVSESPFGTVTRTDRNFWSGISGNFVSGAGNKAVRWNSTTKEFTVADTTLVGNNGTINIFNDTTLVICSNGTNLCDTIYITNIANIQTVTILNDSTLQVCDSLYVCDTLSIPKTTFDNDWSLTGNAISSSANNFIGTLNSSSFRVRTNNVERIVVDSVGFVGIGTATPQQPVEIVNTSPQTLLVRNPDATKFSSIRFFNDQNSNGRALELGYTGSNYNNGSGWGALYGQLLGESGYVTSSGNYPLSFGTGDTLRMLLTPQGQVGIGTNSPSSSAIFHVASTTKGSIPAPKMTAAQRIALSSPIAGLMVFDTDSASAFQYNGSVWQNLYNTGGSGGSVAWGSITGTLSAQTDLQTALNAKLNISDTAAMLAGYQRDLIAGTNVTIVGNTISATGGGGSLTPIPNFTALANVSGASAVPDTVNYSIFNILDFGLIGDSSTDNTTALRNMRDRLPDNAFVFAPAGDYLFSDSIIFNRGINILGAGQEPYDWYSIQNNPKKGGTNFYFTATNKDFLIFKGTSANKSPVNLVTGIGLINTNATAVSSVGIRIDSSQSRSTFRDVSIRGFYINMVQRGIWTTIDNCAFIDPVYWCLITDSPVDNDFGGVNVTNSKFMSGLRANNTGNGVWVQGGGLFNFKHNDFNATANFDSTTQFDICFYADWTHDPQSEMLILGNSFDNYNQQALKIWRNTALNPNTANGSIIVSDNIVSYNRSPTLSPIEFRNLGQVQLANNMSVGDAGAAFIWIDSCRNVSITKGVVTGYHRHDSVTNTLNVARTIRSVDNVVDLESAYYNNIPINTQTTGSPFIQFKLNNTLKAGIYSPRNANDFIAGDATGDLDIRIESGNLNVSVDGGTTKNWQIGTSIIPGVNNSYDLGSSSLNLRDGWFSRQLTLAGYNTSNYTLRTGDFIFQPFGASNGLIANNSYYNGGHKALSAGYGSGFQMYDGQVLLYGMNTVAAAAAQTKVTPFKVDYNGNVAMGGDIDATLGGFTGAAMIIKGTINDYADNAAALSAGLTAGMVYRTGDLLKIVH